LLKHGELFLISSLNESISHFLFPLIRLDWFGAGPSSPNKTGAFLALLFVIVWWWAFRFRWGFWLSLLLSIIISVFLLQTGSRGALLALILAIGLLFIFWIFDKKQTEHTPQQIRVSNILKRYLKTDYLVRSGAIIISLFILGFYSSQLTIGHRISKMLIGEDESTNVRYSLYKSGFKMIAASHQGWGNKQATKAYKQWYQKLEDDRSYLSLVNSHLTWMVEYGIIFQFFYISGWIMILFICMPLPWMPLQAMGFSSWIVLGVTGIFSSVLTLIWLWVIPVALFIVILLQRFYLKQWPNKQSWKRAIAFLLFLFIGLQLLTRLIPAQPKIIASVNKITLNKKDCGLLIINPNKKILGDKYGYAIREDIALFKGVTVLLNTNELHHISLNKYSVLLFSGTCSIPKLNNFLGRIVCINPHLDFNVALQEKFKKHKVQIIIGSLENWRNLQIWKNRAKQIKTMTVIEVPEAQDYIPNWIRYCAIKKVDEQ